MNLRLAAALLALALPALAPPARADQSAPAVAAAPAAELMTAPADAETWVITSVGGRHGQSQRWTGPNGERLGRESLLLRGLKTEIDQRLTLAPDGTIARLDVRGSTPQGDAGERFAVEGGRFSYRSPVDRGDGAYARGRNYVPFGGTIDITIALAEALVRAPGRALELLPSGRAALEPLTTLTVSNGRQTKALSAYALTGIGFAPFPIWFEGDRAFGIASFLNFLPQGWEGVALQLSQAQDAALAKRAPAEVARIARPAGALAFTNARLFDADALVFRDAHTVVIRDGRIAAVGPTASTPVPSGARAIDARGKTLVPGLWDSHQHYGDDGTGPLLLAQGVLSVRDPGNRPEESTTRRRRIEAGQLLGPRIVSSMLIDGPGPLAAQVAVIVNNAAEATAAIDRAKREGFTGVKLYGSLDPALVKPIATQARALGLRVHGHIPRTMRTIDAVRAGYDEITHINWVMMQALPDDVIAQSNGLARFYGPARHATDVDLKSPAMTAYLDELARRGTAVDPTLAIFENGYCGTPGEVSPVYAAYVGTLPPAIERAFKAGGFAELADLKRPRMCASFQKLLDLTVELNRRGVPVLAGTDGSGLELVRDLELYVRAGMTPAQSLATATIIPARAFKLERETGSIAPGKRAEIVLIDGDPSRDIGALRQVELVVQGDRIMQAADLRAAAGLSGPPRRAN